jgi:hypothetical protein
LTQVDQSLEIFTGIPLPDGIARSHLARAAIFTNLAEGDSDGQQIAEHVERALDACLTAQRAVNFDGVNAREVFDVYYTVSGLLLQLRELSDHEEYRKQLEELIDATSTVLGEVAAIDLQLRDEGGAMLETAQLLGALAEIEEDEREREELITAQSMMAYQAAVWLENTSDPELNDQVWEEFQLADAKLEGSAGLKPESQDGPEKCPACDLPSLAGAKFCAECGAQLRGGK